MSRNLPPRATAATAAAAATLLALTAAGCTLAFGLDTAEYTRGSGDAGSPGLEDAAVVSVPDAGDGSVDTGAPPLPSPCVPGNTFLVCEDFESGTLSNGWYTPDQHDGATFAIDNGDARTGTHSAAFVSPALGRAYLTHELGADAAGDTTFRLSLRVASQTANLAIVALNVSTYFIRIDRLVDGTIVLEEFDLTNGQSTRHTANRPIADGAPWADLRLNVHFVNDKQPGSQAELFIDGTSVVGTALTPTVTSGSLIAALGVLDGPNGTSALRVDDVIITRP